MLYERIRELEAEVERLQRLEPEIVEHVLDGRDLTDAAWTEAVIAIRHWRDVAEAHCDCLTCSAEVKRLREELETEQARINVIRNVLMMQPVEVRAVAQAAEEE